jgi:hypothetical protein
MTNRICKAQRQLSTGNTPKPQQSHHTVLLFLIVMRLMPGTCLRPKREMALRAFFSLRFCLLAPPSAPAASAFSKSGYTQRNHVTRARQCDAGAQHAQKQNAHEMVASPFTRATVHNGQCYNRQCRRSTPFKNKTHREHHQNQSPCSLSRPQPWALWSPTWFGVVWCANGVRIGDAVPVA